MKLRIPDKVNPNCYVFKLGWTYPICIFKFNEFRQAKRILKPIFGLAATQRHFGTQWQGQIMTPIVINQLSPSMSPLDAKYYADSIKWREQWTFPENFWIVFKEEKDRTLALMMLS